MALTNKGYKRETYEDIVNRMEIKAKELFGQDVKTTEKSFVGIFIRIMSYFLALVWEDNENVYNSAYRDTAEGKQLDALLPYAGTARESATVATGQATFTGNAGTFIEIGTAIAKEDETLYYTVEDATVGTNGTVIVPIIAEENGTVGNADIGTITKIVNPIDGLSTVFNAVALTDGREMESDHEVREKASITVEGQGAATTASIRTALLQVANVRAAFVDENYTDITNEYNTPPRAFQAFVLGGNESDIAQAVLDTKCAGILPFGTSTATAIDLAGQTKQIGFTRAQTVNIYAKVTLTTNSEFQGDGNNQVIKAIVQYIGGLDADNNVYNGLNMGENVILSKLIAKIYSVPGIDDVDVQLSKNGTTYADSNIVITQQQVAEITANAIEVI